MERLSSSKSWHYAMFSSTAALALLFFSSTLCAKPVTLNNIPEQQTSSVYPNTNTAKPLANSLSPMPDYQDHRPEPLMHGEGFNYDLYYNYHLTPHVILHPNLQQTTKPGAVEDNSRLFVGGLGAEIKF
ncbi:carbohydrate porin [Erwinia sp. INIA-01]|uniref:carbohydrate porin n=1 Tax=Erwinia sp. INIA01 TaxID=2991500 RepID=UPI002225A990|nr:carbohydrate porin [Erwinia sp. INIA01]MCW1876786.1 carbohydrate porin [Erwinia sp. INIA01]